jgi:hypothetical protein
MLARENRMNRKEYKLLCEGWRGYLNEIAVNIWGINKIKSMAENLVQTREGTGRDIYIEVQRQGRDLTVKIKNLDSSENTNNVFFRQVKNYDYEIVDSNVFVKDAVDNLREPWQIMWSEAGGGYGPILYEIGIEVISCFMNGAVMSDRGSVSQEAEDVWNKFKKRSDSEFNLTAVKMDVNDQSLEDFYDAKEYEFSYMTGGEDLKHMKKMTPEDPYDDMYQMSTLDNMFDRGEIVTDWNDVTSSLSYAFYKEEPEVINYMKNIRRSEFDFDIPGENLSELQNDFIKINLQN